jgi:hypothetical protein
MAITKQKLSASNDGGIVRVIASSSPGTLIHTSVSGTSDWDEIWLWAIYGRYYAQHTYLFEQLILRVEYGGTSDPDDVIRATIRNDNQGAVLVVPGLLLQNELVIRAYAEEDDYMSEVQIAGFVNRITA